MKKLLLFTILFPIFSSIFSQNNDILIEYRKGDLFGYADTTGKIVIEPIYDEVISKAGYLSGLYKFVKGNTRGIISKNNKVLFEGRYNEITSTIHNYVIIAKDDEGSTLFSKKGSKLIKHKVKGCKSFKGRDFIRIKLLSNKVGVLNLNKEKTKSKGWLIKPNYESIYFDDETSTFECRGSTEDYYYFDETNKFAKSTKAEAVARKKDAIEKRLAKKLKDSPEQLENLGVEMDEEVNDYPSNDRGPIFYSLLTSFPSEGMFLTDSILVKYKYNRNQPRQKYDTVGIFKSIEIMRTESGFSNKGRKGPLSNQLAKHWGIIQNKKDKFGVVDEQGDIFIPFQYDEIKNYTFAFDCIEPMLICRKEDKWGLINFKNEIVLPFDYEEILFESDKFKNLKLGWNKCKFQVHAIITKKDGKYGMTNEKNEQVLSHIYDEISFGGFMEMQTKKDGLYGMYWRNRNNLKLEKVEPFSSMRVTGFRDINGYRVYSVRDKDTRSMGFADKKGFFYFEGNCTSCRKYPY